MPITIYSAKALIKTTGTGASLGTIPSKEKHIKINCLETSSWKYTFPFQIFDNA